MIGMERYPHLYPPIDADPVEVNDFDTINNGSEAQIVATVKGRPGFEGYLPYWDISLNDYNNAFFIILSGGTPLKDYVQIPGSMNPLIPRIIKIKANQEISLAVTNNSGAAVGARWTIYGWFVPLEFLTQVNR